MKKTMAGQVWGLSLVIGCAMLAATGQRAFAEDKCLSPTAIIADRGSHELYVAEYTGQAVAVVATSKGDIARRISTPGSPSALALSPDDKTLYVAVAEPAGTVQFVNAATGDALATVAVGHTPSALALSPDGAVLYACNRFTNDVSVIDVASKKESARIPVIREPVAAAITPDGAQLCVANLLPAGAADGDFVAAAVSLIDTATKQVTNLVLPNGSSSLNGVCMSPDGKYAYVTHILAHYQLPTTQLERGWMNTNALSIVDLVQKKLLNTVLLDEVDLGAANPCGVACTADGKLLCVALAGTHELMAIDREAMHARLDKAAAGERVTEVSATAADVPSDLSFLTGMRRRIALQGLGPRSLVLAGTKAYVADYFSDGLDVVDIAADAKPGGSLIALGPVIAMSPERKGELLFSDARMCFQHWQSCISCHPDARVDAFNWDLLNDGIGNPKNTKSMLLAHQTPPAMSLGVREKAEVAVRAGMKFIQFTVRPEEDAMAIDAYLKSLKPVPSPLLVDGALSPAARRGKEVFEKAGCAVCHPEPLYTDKKQYDVGTGKDLDAGQAFDTPTLVEVWRTAPYLHDGRSATMGDLLTKDNPKDLHGRTSGLTADEIGDLVAFVLSL